MLAIQQTHSPSLSQVQQKTSSKKLGISVISCKFLNQKKRFIPENSDIKEKNNKNTKRYKMRKQTIKDNRQGSKPLRSLSAQRIRWKKQKNRQKIVLKQDEVRQEMKSNINMLQIQYDQLKLKRSLMTQRQSQKSGGKGRISQPQTRTQQKYLQSDISNSLIRKCVPKSKINLNLFPQNSDIYFFPPDTQLQQPQQSSSEQNKQNLKNLTNKAHPQKSRQNSNLSSSSRTNIRVSDSYSYSNFNLNLNLNTNLYPKLSSSVCWSSLTNLQVIPIGLNSSLPVQNKNSLESNCVLSKSYFKSKLLGYLGKGIKVFSSSKDDCYSLDNSVVSLQVVRHISRGRLTSKTEQNSTAKQKQKSQHQKSGLKN